MDESSRVCVTLERLIQPSCLGQHSSHGLQHPCVFIVRLVFPEDLRGRWHQRRGAADGILKLTDEPEHRVQLFWLGQDLTCLRIGVLSQDRARGMCRDLVSSDGDAAQAEQVGEQLIATGTSLASEASMKFAAPVMLPATILEIESTTAWTSPKIRCAFSRTHW
jgi:hypothetical protein